ncbi:Prolipoprotein diacylglyceryl transferase [Acididesulfobacillus acetoxydans]|uniref:Prolipoprotein diacylglyceryl transferase n=1 Tax=Acididesulfobacillus acetoxydans TaxID=1561005 RepID=A0A8S0XC29_9FIRM|nr:prolipoprotein diacylglyceryl transferase family protein [Acididesulfobacillus acetoxydans]CAA7601916.1 Prolipoprotein diacylglyceryl transferase [Acididesulfobacillus acetoxydans]CEJ08240.1 Prolipoprotein diacylglyceryl transferase [Acididesulfobacillus acetoxydans]
MNPILFHYGGFAVHYSEVIYAGSFIVSYFLSFRRARTLGFTDPEWERALLYYAAAGLLGSRGGYILTHVTMFEGRWAEVLTPWPGAFTLWGALLGFLAAAQILRHIRRDRPGRSLDVLAPIFPLFLGLAEWGLFTEGEGWGRSARGFLALQQGGVARYPLWLGYSLWFLLTAGALAFRTPKREGTSFAYLSASLGLATLAFTPFTLLYGNAAERCVWGSLAVCAGLGYVFFQAKRPAAALRERKW